MLSGLKRFPVATDCEEQAGFFECRPQRHIDCHGYDCGSYRIDGCGSDIPRQSYIGSGLAQDHTFVEIPHKRIKDDIE